MCYGVGCGVMVLLSEEVILFVFSLVFRYLFIQCTIFWCFEVKQGGGAISRPPFCDAFCFLCIFSFHCFLCIFFFQIYSRLLFGSIMLFSAE